MSKKFTFKTPDGRTFENRSEYRDYMMATFYSFKNKTNEPEPLVKYPGDIDGQCFEIADIDGCTLVIMDNCEQVQIDVVKNSRIFIGSCASSIFIRNCENCVFYTCCRQLRLREVTKSTFYTHSMSEIHIEYSNSNMFAPFIGGYPEHASHLAKANLDPAYNLWYDIFDHNDPNKTRANWSLLHQGEYEDPWFPAGPCDVAVVQTKPGSVVRVEEGGEDFKAFGAEQLAVDLKSIQTTGAPASAPLSPTKKSDPSSSSSSSPLSDEEQIKSLIRLYANYSPSQQQQQEGQPTLEESCVESFVTVLPMGGALTLNDMSAALLQSHLWGIEKIFTLPGCPMSWVTFYVQSNEPRNSTALKTSSSPSSAEIEVEELNIEGGGVVFQCTAILHKVDDNWLLAHVHRSEGENVEDAPEKSKLMQ